MTTTAAASEALRQARGDELTRLILEAPADGVVAALANPHLDEHQMLLLLRRSDLDGALLRTVSEDPAWISSYQVKAAVVSHPHTPKTVAMNLIKFLFWRDLAKLLNNFRVQPAVRRLAEVTLRDRLQDITLGERIALARMAPREAIKVLRTDHSEQVMTALLGNPKTTEEDVLVVASYRRTPPPILALVARSARWSARYHVRLALLRNPRTPAVVAVALLPGLQQRDLTGLLETPGLAPAVRAALPA